jgi:hypothetical protein
MYNKFFFNYKLNKDKISYQFNHDKSLNKLIFQDLNNDIDFNFQFNFHNINLKNIIEDYERIVSDYIQSNNIVITKNIKDLTYQLLVILFSYYKFDTNILYTYDEIKCKLLQDKNIIIKNFEITDIFTFSIENESIQHSQKNDKPKYLIYKSFNGFGDRIQCLLYVINYCLYANRILIIDWTDKVWCDNEDYDFDYYFEIKGINTIKERDFKKIYYKYKNNFSVFPVIWKENIFTNQIFDINHVVLQNQNTILNKIAKQKSYDFEEDIVVYTGCRTRYFHYKLFAKHFIFNNFILNEIYKTDFYKNIISKKINYCVIHLRGGDRMINNGDDTNILWDNNSINQGEYIDNLIKQLDNKYNNILLLSDTISLINKCATKLKNKSYSVYMTNNYKQDNNEGLHRINTISKLQINIEMITDFYFMMKSNQIINDNISIFSNVAKKIRC